MTYVTIVIKGGAVTVDEADAALVLSYQWHLHKASYCVYARGYPKGNRKAGLVYMHRLLTGAPKGKDVDHRDGDGLNNRRSNIRVCSRSQNNANRKRPHGTSSRFKGVYRDAKNHCWRVELTCDGKKHRLGRFADEKEAAKAYLDKALELFGPYAHQVAET